DGTAVHVRVAARLEDEELANVVEVVERVAPLLEDGASAQRGDAATDDAKRFSGGVIVDRAHHQAAAGRRFVHRFMLTQPEPDVRFRRSTTSLVSATLTSDC